jgi:hypothetical protein
MENRLICQSCSMPLDTPELMGTEKDGSKSSEYCCYCYKDGAFTKPGLMLDEMKAFMMEKIENEKIPEDILEAAVLRLPLLKRWKNQGTAVAGAGGNTINYIL